MAHAVHLNDIEIEMLSKSGTSVAHCPASNTLLESGLCDVLRLIEGGIQIGLGSDVSGGNSFCIKDAILHALQVSKCLSLAKKHLTKEQPNANDTRLTYKQAIYLATLGGAQALAMGDTIGNFVIGKQFDALIIDTNVFPLNNMNKLSPNAEKNDDELHLLEKVQRFIYVGDDRNIVQVFVNGKEIKQNLNSI